MPDSGSNENQAGPRPERRPSIESGRIKIRPITAAARFVLRCKPDDIAALTGAFGVPLPRTSCQAAVAGTRASLWLGPDEWLLLTDDGSQSVIEGAFASLSSQLRFSLVDVSHRFSGVTLSGSAAADALSVGCPLDLHDSVFTVSSCTRTLFGKCEIILWRASTNTFRLEFGRSYADYVWRLLQVACSDTARTVIPAKAGIR